MPDDTKTAGKPAENAYDSSLPAEKTPKSDTIAMAMRVPRSVAEEFRQLARETGMEQGYFLKSMIENFRLNEDKKLYKDHAEDIQVMRDLTATINYKYVALIAQNKVEAERAHTKDAKRIEELETLNRELLEEKKLWETSRERIVQQESEISDLRGMLRALERKIEAMTAEHKNEIDALNNQKNAEMNAMAQQYASKYMDFIDSFAKAEKR